MGKVRLSPVALFIAARNIHYSKAGTYSQIMSATISGWCNRMRVVVQVPDTIGEETLVLRLLHDARVVVHPGYFFDFPRGAHIVMSLLPGPDVFSAAIARVLTVVAAS